MEYIKVVWIHSHPDEPVVLYSELDADRWEVRAVEVFRDGKMSFASNAKSSGSTMLGLEPIPSLSEIASDPEFEPSQIDREEFEAVWLEATKG